MKTFFPKLVVLALAVCCSNFPAFSQGLPDTWRKSAWEMVAFFETSGSNFGTITKDFDCQGVSVGILQWNVGKNSFQNEILAHINREVVAGAMRTHGEDFWAAYEADIKAATAKTKEDALLTYVRSFQTYADEASCASRKRKANWKDDSKTFLAELKALITTPEIVAIQEKAVDGKLKAGWNLANAWSKAKYGASGLQSFEEFAFFVDTVNFNGGWWQNVANFAEVCKLRAAKTNEALYAEILDYLVSDLPDQLQADEAAKNAALWRARTPTIDELDLMAMAFLISKNIGAKNAIQFKKNVISRRGTIIFNDGWVNGARKTFSQPVGAVPTREGNCPS